MQGVVLEQWSVPGIASGSALASVNALLHKGELARVGKKIAANVEFRPLGSLGHSCRFVAQSQVDHKVRTDAPIVLDVHAIMVCRSSSGESAPGMSVVRLATPGPPNVVQAPIFWAPQLLRNAAHDVYAKIPPGRADLRTLS